MNTSISVTQRLSFGTWGFLGLCMLFPRHASICIHSQDVQFVDAEPMEEDWNDGDLSDAPSSTTLELGM